MNADHQHYGNELSGTIGQALADLDFPANTATIVAHARQQGLDESIIDALEALPDQIFEELRLLLDFVAGGTRNETPPSEGGQ
ncbi:MAG: DUF2795 domain-containing protein [Bradymonadaceae bacterium]|nr:DUF2795 domain-containing protein [Lujinxingiaceae bacterium]